MSSSGWGPCKQGNMKTSAFLSMRLENMSCSFPSLVSLLKWITSMLQDLPLLARRMWWLTADVQGGYGRIAYLDLGEQNNCAQEPLDILFCLFLYPCWTNGCVLLLTSCHPPPLFQRLKCEIFLFWKCTSFWKEGYVWRELCIPVSFMWIIWKMFCEKICICRTCILKLLRGTGENALLFLQLLQSPCVMLIRADL